MSKYLVTLCILSAALICAPALQGQTLRPGARPPVDVDLKDDKGTVDPGVKPPVKVDFERVVVTGVNPDSHVKLPADGTTVEKRRIVGSNLDRDLTVKVLKGNTPTGVITATLKPTNRSDKRGLWLTAKPEALAGKDYRVRLTDGTRTIDLPLTVEVLPKQLDPSAISSVSSVNLGGGKPALDPAAKDRLLKGAKGGQLKAPPPGGVKADLEPGRGGEIKPGAFGAKAAGVKLPVKPELVEGAAEGAPAVTLEHLAAGGIVDIPEAILQVKRSDAIDAWGNYWADRPAVKNRFRWLTSLDDLIYFRWEVADYPDFKNIIATGQSGTVAEPGRYGYFDVDFAPIVGSRAPPLHYFVRVVPVQRKEGSSSATAGTEADPSNYVHVSIMTPGEITQFDEPVILGVMPFSSCDPGGGLVLKGFQFGEEPGAIWLNHPERNIYLENLEWTPTLVQGTVPMVRGILDSQVSVQVRTKDGRESNFDLTCHFRATREEIRLYELCDGVMIYVDGYYSDITDTHQVPRNDRYTERLVGWHRSKEAQSGVDQVKLPRTPINGWRYTRFEFAQTSSQLVDADLSEPVGFIPGANPHTVGIHWRIGDGADVGWQMYVYAEGPAGVRLWNDKWYEPQHCHPRGY